MTTFKTKKETHGGVVGTHPASVPAAAKQYTVEEKFACSVEATLNVGECESYQ